MLTTHEWSLTATGHRFVEVIPRYHGRFVALYECERCGMFSFIHESAGHAAKAFSLDRIEPRTWTFVTMSLPCRARRPDQGWEREWL